MFGQSWLITPQFQVIEFWKQTMQRPLNINPSISQWSYQQKKLPRESLSLKILLKPETAHWKDLFRASRSSLTATKLTKPATSSTTWRHGEVPTRLPWLKRTDSAVEDSAIDLHGYSTSGDEAVAGGDDFKRGSWKFLGKWWRCGSQHLYTM